MGRSKAAPARRDELPAPPPKRSRVDGRIVGIDLGLAQRQGLRYAACEDRAFKSRERFESASSGVCVVGVLDGHRGAACAEFAARELPRRLLADRRCEGPDAGQALRDSFAAADDEFLASDAGASNAGACALVALIRTPPSTDEDGAAGPPELVIASAGDCRALALDDDAGARRLTTDHSPDLPCERARIEAAGGFVMSDEGCWRVGVLPPAMCAAVREDDDAPRTVNLLAASRCLGDRDFKASGAPVLTCAPDVATFAPSARSRFVLLASDGVFEALSDEQACAVARAALDDGDAPADAAESVVDTAARAGSTDDITAMVLVFRREPPKPGPALPEEGEAPRASPREDA